MRPVDREDSALTLAPTWLLSIRIEGGLLRKALRLLPRHAGDRPCLAGCRPCQRWRSTIIYEHTRSTQIFGLASDRAPVHLYRLQHSALSCVHRWQGAKCLGPRALMVHLTRLGRIHLPRPSTSKRYMRQRLEACAFASGTSLLIAIAWVVLMGSSHSTDKEPAQQSSGAEKLGAGLLLTCAACGGRCYLPRAPLQCRRLTTVEA